MTFKMEKKANSSHSTGRNSNSSQGRTDDHQSSSNNPLPKKGHAMNNQVQHSSRKEQCLCTSFFGLFRDLINTRGAIVLVIIFWPIAIFQMIHAWIQRIIVIGLTQNNVAAYIPRAAYHNEEGVKTLADSNDNQAPVLEDDDESYLLLSGSELARMIKDPGHPLTSITLTKLCIRQVERVNPFLNAVVATRFKEALEEAARADEAVRLGTIPGTSDHDEDPFASLFWGVPILVKECFEVEGMPFTSGVVSRKHIVGTNTAPAVREAQRSGAIVLAVTNISEGCMWHESINRLYGRTYNPYDFQRTCGGSSGGCGAGVASCMTPMAITSDVGGSTRIPAHYNGVFGHKPTGGTVSNEFCFPECGEGPVKNYCQLGPTSKHAEDLWPLLLTLARSQGVPPALAVEVKREPGVEPEVVEASVATTNNGSSSFVLQTYSLSAVREVSIPKIQVFYSTTTLANPLLVSKMHPEIPTRIHQVSKYLSSLGCTVNAFPTSLIIPELFQLLNTFQIWSLLLHEGKNETFKDVIRNQTLPFQYNGLHLLYELFLSIFELSDHTFPAMLLALFEYTVDIAPKSVNDRTRRLAATMRQRLEDFLAGNKVWIMPSLATPAPIHNESTLRIFDVSNTGFFNVMELPVTAIPVGLTTDQGVPIGLQVISGRGQDHLCIAVAKALQEGGLAGWKPPVKA